jgi:hypothetical protein
MGLGPPVCEKCKVLGKISRDFNESFWYCPICNSRKLKWNAWDCGLTDEELEDNYKFLSFVKGTNDASTGG